MSIQIRPQFQSVVSCPPARTMRHLKRELIQQNAPCTGTFYDRHAILSMPGEEQHFWSPQLSLDFDSHTDGTLVRGLFAPKPSVWTMYVAAYAFLGFGGLIGLIFGTSQMSLGMEANALWSVPFAAVLAVMVYGTAWVGQRLSREQMATMRAFLDKTLDDCNQRERSEVA